MEFWKRFRSALDFLVDLRIGQRVEFLDGFPGSRINRCDSHDLICPNRRKYDAGEVSDSSLHPGSSDALPYSFTTFQGYVPAGGSRAVWGRIAANSREEGKTANLLAF